LTKILLFTSRYSFIQKTFFCYSAEAKLIKRNIACFGSYVQSIPKKNNVTCLLKGDYLGKRHSGKTEEGKERVGG
jgi:hypothetical protein